MKRTLKHVAGLAAGVAATGLIIGGLAFFMGLHYLDRAVMFRETEPDRAREAGL